jgi:hypothetical protein
MKLFYKVITILATVLLSCNGGSNYKEKNIVKVTNSEKEMLPFFEKALKK